jgi:hypothetical protein
MSDRKMAVKTATLDFTERGVEPALPCSTTQGEITHVNTKLLEAWARSVPAAATLDGILDRWRRDVGGVYHGGSHGL